MSWYANGLSCSQLRLINLKCPTLSRWPMEGDLHWVLDHLLSVETGACMASPNVGGALCFLGALCSVADFQPLK